MRSHNGHMVDAAYAAGFFDGEGCVHIARELTRGPRVRERRPIYVVQTVVANTNRAVLEWHRDRWCGAIIAVPKSSDKWRRSYAWRLSGFASEPYLREIRPFLKVKCELVDNAVDLFDHKRQHCHSGVRTPDDVLAAQHEFWVCHRRLIR